MLHMHIITAVDDVLNDAVAAHGSYSSVETTRLEKDGDIAGEVQANRIAPMHPEVEALRPLEHMRARTLPPHVFYTVVAYRRDANGTDIGVTTAIIAPGAPDRDVTTMTRDELAAAARRQFQPLLDAPVAPMVVR